MSELKVEIRSASKEAFTGVASDVYLPTAMGEIGVLPGHCNIVGVVGEGECRVTTVGGVQKFKVKGGSFRVTDGKLLVLAEAIGA